MTYTIEWARSAAREVRALQPQVGLRVAEAVGSLAQEPRPTGCKKLAGHKDLWRVRVGQYRVIYFIADTIKLVRIERVSHRKEAYR